MSKSSAASELISGIEAIRQLTGSRRRLDLCRRPTPIHALPRLSEHLGVSVYCKRDDLTGFGFGGNKIRKLEYLVRDAVDSGADTLVTCGSNQSNWCRMTAVAGAVAGLDVCLVLGGGKPDALTGNLLLDHMVGADMHHFDTDDDDELESISADRCAELESNGRKPYRILMGGSNGLGTLGYIDAFGEILEYEAASGTRFGTIIVATGSGGTQAGLIVGQVASGWSGSIVGMAASRAKVAQMQQVRRVLARFDDFAGTEVSGAGIITNDSYVGAGYRKRTRACDEAIELFARREGLFLDQVYTGKAAAGLIDYARKGRFADGENVLFVHTGGSVQLFE